ncbi:L-rhamnono-gamma-lactonase [Beauveria bassiana]|uniref:L-rhamnono-gamma-lactonase n=1 Tax=Beauveria bassiana TaxID=176275 RepID=A0A2N6NK34_BEABA|nr:L-rhamnono-gamma-lactonase [Beauveria bassiana]
MASSDQQLILPIIDSHIHLYPSSELDTLAWTHPEHPLHGQRSLEQYKADTQTAPSLLGFVLIEADRKHDLASPDGASGWAAPLQEVRWARRIALGEPRDGEGHTSDDKKLCLGIIPWAPLPSGPAVLERYLKRVEEEAGDAWPKVKGFRYLLQDKPNGTMLEQDFVDSLKLLGRRGFVFEVPRVYMKLSGALAEMPPALRAQDAAHIFQSTFGWLGVVLATFGPRRIMFGSDWPVCTVDMPDGQGWTRWKGVVDKMCWMASLDDDERAMIYGGTAKEAYGL